MPITTLTFVLIATVCTAFISGVFGMAGGMILMGILTWILPVSTAMVLHGIIQLTSNGLRSILHRKYIQWAILRQYLLGAFFCLFLFLFIVLNVNKTTVFLILGSLPFISLMIPKSNKLNITRPMHSLFCGFMVTSFHLTAGVSGPMLDIFYPKHQLNRHQVIATKAITQALGHFIKIIYFSFFITRLKDVETTDIVFWVYPAVICTTILGTSLSKFYLNKINDHQFYNWTQRLLIVVGCVYLWRGLQLL